MRIRKWSTIGFSKQGILAYAIHLVLSYIILLALCIAFFLFPSRLAIQEFKKQEQINQSTEISHYISNADFVLKTIRNVATDLLSEEPVLDMAYLQTDTPNIAYYKIIKNIKQINSLYGDQFNRVYLYFNNQNALLGVTGKLDLQLYFETTLSHQISKEQFDRLLQKQQKGVLFYSTNQYLFTVQTLPINYPGGQYINLIFSIPINSLFKIQEKSAGVPSAFGLRFQDSTMTVGGNQQTKSDIDIIQDTVNSSVSGKTISSRTIGNNLLYYGNSQEASLVYFFVVSPNTYNEVLENYILYIEVSLVLFFLLAGFIILFSVRHQFQPIQKTFAAINSSCIGDLSYRECRTVEEYVLHLRNERDTYHDFISKQRQSLKEIFILQLVKGEISDLTQYKENIQMFGIQFLSPYFCVVIINMIDRLGIPEKGENAELDNSYPFVIRNVVSDLLSEYFCIETFRNEQQICCVLNAKNSSLNKQESYTLIKNKFLFALDFLKEKANVYCNITIGDFYEGFSSIQKSYFEAMSCIEQRYLEMIPQVVFYSDLSQSSVPEQTAFPSIYTVETNHLFLTLLKNGDAEGASKVVRHLLDQLNLVAKHHPLAMQNLCHNLLCAFTKVFEGLDIVDGDLIKQITDLFGTEFFLYPVDYIYTTFNGLCEKVCKNVQDNRQRNLQEICAKVNQYILDHYTDENLCASKIAEDFSVNVDYLTSLYKKQEGANLHKVITHIRIKKACELLSLPSAMTIDDVALKVGFNNVRTFYRVFTGEMSVSPAKYRSNKLDAITAGR